MDNTISLNALNCNESEYIIDAGRILSCALDIGEQMLISGAEIARVEDSITRICSTYGAERVDVFTITSSIVVTMKSQCFGTVTQTRRIKELKYNLNRLHLLNRLSRNICKDRPSIEYIISELEVIKQSPVFPYCIQMIAYALISGAFTVFFGGTLSDCLCSAIIGFLLKLFDSLMSRLKISGFFSSLTCSCMGGFFAAILVRLNVGDNLSLINLGNIMLLIPGIALTNSIRDMFGGDTISGLLRFAEAMLLAMTVALGFALTANIF